MFEPEIDALGLAPDLAVALANALAAHSERPWSEALAEGLWALDPRSRGAALLALAPAEQIAICRQWLAQSGTLDLKGLGLTALPSAVLDLTIAPHVARLDLSENALTDLPTGFADLSALTDLDLSGNPLGALPPPICALTGLRTLKLNQCGLSALPDALGDLRWLNRLDLAHNTLTALPDVFGDLDALSLLRLDHNPLTDLPASLGRCGDLRKIALGDTALQAIPEALFELPRLELLHGLPGYASREAQEALPRALRLAKGHDLPTAPLAAALLERPQDLDRLSAPATLALLRDLADDVDTRPPRALLLSMDLGEIALGLARLQRRPAGVAEALTGLFVVAKYAEEDGLKAQAKALLDAHAPEDVQAALADRARIPSQARKGEKKTTAHLEAFAARCPSVDWAEVGLALYRRYHTGLRYVFEQAPDHSDVKIRALEALMEGGRLRYFDGYATYMPDYLNSFSHYPSGHFPIEVVEMPQITALDLKGCRLSELPPELGHMTWLVELDLTGNQLTELPESLARLTALERLHLDDNAFAELPPVLWRLSGLRHLSITDNRQGAERSPLSLPDDLRVALPACTIVS